MPSPLRASIDQLVPVIRASDAAGFQRIFERLAADSRGLPPEELTAAVEELAPVLAGRPMGRYSRLALVAGAYVEWGAAPVALAADAPRCALTVLRLRAAFGQLWPLVGGGRPEPDTTEPPIEAALVQAFQARAASLGLSGPEAIAIALSWYEVEHWVDLMITLMGRRAFRDAAGLLPDIGEAAAKLADVVPRAGWLPGLSAVLDGAPVVVLDHATGRGYRLTMSGVGDNYQLHTLLADRLIGDPGQGLLRGERPPAAWVAAATEGSTRPADGQPILRRYRLYDAAGGYIYPEGRPADIPTLDGVRVIILHPPQGEYGWVHGRVYEGMRPTLTLDHIMTPFEVQDWGGRVAPARETDGA